MWRPQRVVSIHCPVCQGRHCNACRQKAPIDMDANPEGAATCGSYRGNCCADTALPKVRLQDNALLEWKLAHRVQ